MDTVRFGRQARALRRRRGWRQADLAAAAKVSRPLISRVERGHADELTLATLEAIAKALSARLNLVMTWNGEALDRLLDADHAALVDIVAATLRTLEWLVAVEVSFNIRGEWGSIDVLAFHPATGVVLVVEVKSVVPDLQATISPSTGRLGWGWKSRPSADGTVDWWVGSSLSPTAARHGDV